MPLLSWEEYQKGERLPEISAEPPEENLEEEALTEEASLQRLNSATAEELQSIKGIGPKIAQKIVGNMPYRNFEDFNERAALSRMRHGRLLEWLEKTD